MNDTPLIRRVVTADRYQVTVTAQEALDAIESLGSETFTTRDIVEQIKSHHPHVELSRLEYAVRAAVKWLMNRGYVKTTDKAEKRMTRAKEAYWVTVYQRIDRGGPCDVCLLNRIFLGMEAQKC